MSGPPSSDAGRILAGRYELVSPLGEGGMGVVWRARDTRLGRPVAVKLLGAASLGSELARKRLVREAQAAAALEHEGIIRVYDVGETDDGGAFLVMELVRGKSFRSEIAAERPSLRHVSSVIVQAARALHVANHAGIVHRDIKPDNIMIRDTGTAIVVDFGVAKPVATDLLATAETVAGLTSASLVCGAHETTSRRSASLTGTGQLVGTPAYLSPEQARGAAVTAATDQFALAVTAYEAITGKLPWKGGGMVEIVASILRDDPEPMASFGVTVPEAIEQTITRALAKEPEARWSSLAEFADALEEAAADLPAAPDDPEPSARSRRAPASSSGKTPVAETPVPEGATRSSPVHEEAVTPGAADPDPSQRKVSPVFIGVTLVVVLAVGWRLMRAPENTAASAAASAAVSVSVAPPPPRIAGIDCACPPFVVTPNEESWLGAPAAAIACDRLSLSHGGVDGRVLGPAELARTPRELTGLLPPLFERAEDRAAAVETARGAARWIDGKLEKEPTGYVAHVFIRDPSGVEIGHGEGRGVEIFEAVRDALKPALATPTKEESEALQRWLDVATLDEASDLFDVHSAALIEDPVSLKEACVKVAARTTLAPRVRYLANARCVQRLRSGTIDGPPPAIDDSTPGALITTSLAQGATGGGAAVRERALRLEKERDATSSPEAKARFAAAAAELQYGIGDEHAIDNARAATRFSPRAIDWRVSAWHRLAFLAEGDASVGTAAASWQPWEPVFQSLRIAGKEVDNGKSRASAARRAFLLSQRGYYARAHGEALLAEGRLEEARGIAELTNDELLRVDIMLSEARYAAILAKVPRLVAELPGNDENASLAFRIAHDATFAALILERPAEFMDTVVTRWVESEPHHVIDGVVPFVSLVTACCLAPRKIGKRCIGRLTQLRAEAKLPTIFSGAETTLAGAARYVEDDYTGAAKAWRTLLRTPRWIQEPLYDPMAIAFDKSDQEDLAAEIDASSVANVGLPRPAEPAWVRAARRANKKGDVAAARKLAEAVVDKWRFADEDVPAVREMKALLAKLPKP